MGPPQLAPVDLQRIDSFLGAKRRLGHTLEPVFELAQIGFIHRRAAGGLKNLFVGHALPEVLSRCTVDAVEAQQVGSPGNCLPQDGMIST